MRRKIKHEKEIYDFVVVTNKILPYREPFFRMLNSRFKCFFILTQENQKSISKIQWLKGNYFIPKQIKIHSIVPLTFILNKLFTLKFKNIFSLPSVYPEAWQAFIVAKLKKKKIYFHDEEFEWKKNLKRRILMPFTSFMNRHANYILVPTSKHIEWHLKNGVKKKKIILFPNVTNISKKNLNLNEIKKIKRKYALNGKIVIMYIGQLIKRKGINYLINAYDELLKEHKRLRKGTVLLIIGNGNLKEDLMNQAKNVDGEIIFVGYVNNQDLPEYYSIANVGVVPSINVGGMAEPYALVVNEFLEFGKPVIATEMVGASYYFFYEKDIIKEKNASEIKNKLSFLLNGGKIKLKNSKNLKNNYKCQFEAILKLLK